MKAIPPTVSIEETIRIALPHCDGIQNIAAAACQNQSYKLTITLSDGKKEPISLFSLEGRTNEAAAAALAKKVHQYLCLKKEKRIIYLASGALLNNESGIEMRVCDGQLVVNGRPIISTEFLHTYTHFTATLLEERILKIADESPSGEASFFFDLKEERDPPNCYTTRDAIVTT